MIEGEFPSVRYVYETLGARLGAEIVVVPSPGGDGLAADEDAELDRAFTAIDAILSSRVWRRWRDHPALVT